MPVNGIAIQAVFFIAFLCWVSVIDIKTRSLPDWFHVLIALTALLQFETWNLIGIFTALPLLCAAMICGGMGGGDVKLMAACGLVLGLPYGMLAEIIGLSVMLGYFVVYQAVQKRRGSTVQRAFPLAPFLSVGCITSYVIRASADLW